MIEATSTNNGHTNGKMAGATKPVKMPKQIIKRDGRIVEFDLAFIENAIAKCFASINRTPVVSVDELALQAANVVAAKFDARPAGSQGYRPKYRPTHRTVSIHPVRYIPSHHPPWNGSHLGCPFLSQ